MLQGAAPVLLPCCEEADPCFEASAALAPTGFQVAARRLLRPQEGCGAHYVLNGQDCLPVLVKLRD